MLIKDADKLFKDETGKSALNINWDLATTIYEAADYVVVMVLLAGVNPSKIEISMNESLLKIKGQREEPPIPQGARIFRKEIQGGSFTKTISLPTDVKRDQSKADFVNGVLKIILPKQESVTKISVQQIKIKGSR